jgi:hypothetical protein
MNPLLMCRNIRSLKLHKKQTTKSRETIPLRERGANITLESAGVDFSELQHLILSRVKQN